MALEIFNNILFHDAILVCDTISRLYGLGKSSSVMKIKTVKHFCEQAEIFKNNSADRNDIIQAGERALVLLYGGCSKV